ncbi:MAG: hypothetical protein ACOCWZ_08480 [Spirochaetota bacterium]
MKIQYPLLIVYFCVVLLNSCSHTPEQGQASNGPIEATFHEVSLDPEEYLVPESQYTTSGAVFQEKHRSLMLDLVEDINSIKSHQVKEKTVGFYYDQKTKDRNHLYLGYDLIIYDSTTYNADSYTSRALKVIRTTLQPLLDRSRNVYPILDEKPVIGLVLGFYWTLDGKSESVTAWIDASDLKKYHGRRITFNECMVRSIYTGQDNKIIRLL